MSVGGGSRAVWGGGQNTPGVLVRLVGEVAARRSVRMAYGRAELASSGIPTGEHENEDAACAVALPGGGMILAVADGASGQPMGRAAASTAIDALAPRADEAPSREHIVRAFEDANDDIIAMGVGAATTLVAAEVSPDGMVRTYHAGDSVSLLIGQRGAIKAVTLAHNPAAYAVEAGFLTEDEAHDHADRSMLTNCLGIDGLRIEVGGRLAMARRDTLLLVSDGITDNLTTNEIVELCRKGPIDRCADGLITAARDRMLTRRPGWLSKPDDATAVLFRLGQ